MCLLSPLLSPRFPPLVNRPENRAQSTNRWSVGWRASPFRCPFFKTALFRHTERKLTPRISKSIFSFRKRGTKRNEEETIPNFTRSNERVYTISGWTSNRIVSIIFTVQRIFASRPTSRKGKRRGMGEKTKRGGEKIFAGEAAAMSAADVADPPTNLNPLRSNLAVVGRELGRVNIGAVSFNEPCAPLLFRKRARRRSFGRKRFPSAAAAAATVPLSLPRSGAKFMRPTGLKPIECLSARFGLNGTRLLPDIRKYRPTVSRLIQTRWSIRKRGDTERRGWLLRSVPSFRYRYTSI